MNSEDGNPEIRRCAISTRKHVSATLSSWLESSWEPKSLEILCVGTNGPEDFAYNPDHDGFGGLINALHRQLNVYRAATAFLNHTMEGRKTVVIPKIEVIYFPSLIDDSGSSIFSNLENLPTILIFLTHGTSGPYPSLVDDVCYGTGSITAERAVSELNALSGRNLLTILPICFAESVSRRFQNCEKIGSVYAPLDEEISESLVPVMHRGLSTEIRKNLDISKLIRDSEVLHAEA